MHFPDIYFSFTLSMLYVWLQSQTLYGPTPTNDHILDDPAIITAIVSEPSTVLSTSSCTSSAVPKQSTASTVAADSSTSAFTPVLRTKKWSKHKHGKKYTKFNPAYVLPGKAQRLNIDAHRHMPVEIRNNTCSRCGLTFPPNCSPDRIRKHIALHEHRMC